MNELLKLENVSAVYNVDGRVIKAVDCVSACIWPGEIVGLIGESGCGKTTLGFSIARLLPKQAVLEGGIIFDDVNMIDADESQLQRIRGKLISYIFQEPSASLNPVLTCGFQIQEMIMAHERIGRAQAKQKSVKLMSGVGIKDADKKFNSYPHQLSGGEKQRILIAMAISLSPKLIIADEPTTALDVTLQSGILSLLIELRKRHNLSILFITHDLNIAKFVSDRCIIMYAGRIVEIAGSQDIFKAPLMPYTMGLLKCVPKIGNGNPRLEQIEGEVADLADLPAGCKFHPRCKYRKQVCLEKEPQLVLYANGHLARCHFAGQILWKD